ncbi:MAG: hypothetical protein KGI06_05865 [Candidatus Micrarchaeota archaeon]|nr:hypothetical protein [Candidatus Micrarchaeota archaeon]
MATHLAAFNQNTHGISLAALDVIADTILTPNSADNGFQVPPDYSTIAALAALGNGITRAQIDSPSLEVKREVNEIIPRASGASKFSLGFPEIKRMKPELPLDITEIFQILQSDGAGVDFQHYALAWLKQPGPLPAPPAGEIRRIRCTASATLTANGWTLATIVPDKSIEAGTYAIVNMIAISANLIAARLLLSNARYRPGVAGFAGTEAAAVDANPGPFAGDDNYLMGTFDNTTFPQVEFLSSVADTSETVFLDVILTGGAPAPTTPAGA